MNSEDKSILSTKSAGNASLVLFLLAVVGLGVGVLALWPGAQQAAGAAETVVLYKTPTCGCCNDWVDHLRDAGLDVAVVNVESTQDVRAQAGVPNRLGSCHTAVVGDYFVEGHVPADLVRGLIESQPGNLRGITVPGMPIGSPGMEGPNPVEYDVLALDSDGKVFVYATRQGSSSPDGH